MVGIIAISHDDNARLDWGIPLTDFEVQGNTSSEQDLYFTVNYSFFLR